MKGLFFYYKTLQKKNTFFSILVGIIIIIVSFMENLHELTILYFTLLPTFIFNYSTFAVIKSV